MSTGKSVSAFFFGLMMLAATATQAQTVGADRIYAAEAKAAALKAENEQLRKSINTQSNALKRLESEFELIQQNNALELKNLREDKLALERRLLQVEQGQSQSMARAGELETQLSAAQADSVRIEGLLAESQAKNQALQEQISALQAQLSEQQALLKGSSNLEQQLAQAKAENLELGSQITQLEQALQESRESMRNMQGGLNELSNLKAQLSQSQNAHSETETRLQEALTELVELRRTVGTDLEPTRAENERLQAQLQFLQERNNALQEAAATTASAEEVTAMYQQNVELEDALRTANTQLDELRVANQRLQSELAGAQQPAGDPQLANEHAALQAEYNSLLDGLRSCEARVVQAGAQPARSNSMPSSLPEDIRRISELESALDRANQEIRNLNQAFESELQVERAMAAGTQAELESSYQNRINQLQSQLESCQGG